MQLDLEKQRARTVDVGIRLLSNPAPASGSAGFMLTPSLGLCAT